MLNSIKTLKRYFKVSLNVFFSNKKFWWWQKISPIYDRFLVSNRNFTTENIYIIKNSRFFQVFRSKFQVFSKISQIPGFSRLFLPKLWNSRFFQVKWQLCNLFKSQNKIDLSVHLIHFSMHRKSIRVKNLSDYT